MNENIVNYQADLDAESAAAIKSLNREVKHAGLSQAEIDAKVKEIISKRIVPIADRYDGLIADEAEIESRLDAISAKIKTAFAPKVAVHETREADDEEDGFDESDLESSESYKKLLKKIDFYRKAAREIKKVKKEIEADPYNYSRSDVIARLSPYMDLFFESGLKVDFVIKAKSKDTGEREELHQNDTLLLSDIATAISLNKDPSKAWSEKDVDSFTRSVFGRLQVPEASVPKGKDLIIKLLTRKFVSLVPDFKQLEEDLMDQATELSGEKVKVYENSVKEIGRNHDRILSPQSEKLKIILDDFGEELRIKGYKKGEIDEEKQDSLVNTLSEKIKPILLEVNTMLRPFSENKRNLNDLMSLIQSYEEASSLNLRKLNSGRIKQETFDDRQEELVDELAKKSRKLTKEFKEFGLKKEQIENPGELEDAKQRIKLGINQLESTLEMYRFFQEELTEQKSKFVGEWGLDGYLLNIENTPVDKLTPWQIVKYVFGKEVAFWTPLHQESDNKFLRDIVNKIKYNFGGEGKGYEDPKSRAGTDNDWWATSEGRTIMGLLQTYAVYATVLHGEHYAEGDKTKLFPALTSYKVTREGLYTQGLGHPIYGKFLEKILEISQYWPMLRTGSLPPISSLSDLSLLQGRMKPEHFLLFRDRLDRSRARGGADPEKLTVLHERYVIRGGQRIKLAADRYVKDEEGDWAFYPGEELQRGDELILDGDSRYSYQTLSGNIGRNVASDMQKQIIEMIKANPKRFGLNKKDIPKKEENLFAATSMAQFLFYSFPFLTTIYSGWEEETQTASHKVNPDDFNWNRLFSILSEAIQDADRYGLRSGLMWAFIYYAPFKDGVWGASGNPDRINRLRNLMIAHQKYVFGEDAMSHIVGKLDSNNNFAVRNGFTTALDMLKISEGEMSRLFGDIIDEDGRVNPGSFEHPHKIGPESSSPIPAYDWDLFQLSAKAYLKLLETTIKDLAPGSISTEDLEEGQLNPITQLLFKVMGQFKMWFFGKEDDPTNVLKKSSSLLFHSVLRHANAATSETAIDSTKVYSSIEIAMKSAIGKTGSGPKVNRGLGSGPVGKAIEETLRFMEGHGDRHLYDDGKPSLGENIARMAFSMTRGLTGGLPKPDPRMSDGFSPDPKSVFDRRYPLLIDYAKLLWEDMSENHITDENPLGLGPWPFTINVDLGFDRMVEAPAAIPVSFSMQESEWLGYVKYFKAMLKLQVDVPSPLKRPKFDN